MHISIKTFIFVAQKEVLFLMNRPLLIFARYIFLSLIVAILPISVQAQNFQNQSDLQWVAVPSHADWLYKTGEKAQIEVQLLWHGQPASDVEIAYGVGGDCLPSDTEGKVRTNAQGKATIMVGTSEKPGFRDTQMRCSIEGISFKNHLKVGFDAEQIRPYTQKPADFEAYWQQVLEEQSQVPMHVEATPAPQYDTEKATCQLVKIRCYRKQGEYNIYGYLTKPRKEGRYPVLVSPPGAGVKPMDPVKTIFYAEQGDMIRLDLEIHGINPALSAADYKDISRAFGEHYANGYLANGLQSRETYYFRHVYAAMIRAVDYLVSLPEWDGQHVFVQGNSQGAALSIVLAALDPRVSAIAIAHPALSDMAGYIEPGRTGGYPHFGNKYKDVKLTPEVIKTLSYYDVINFARLVRCPVYMTWGYNDNTCPPTTSWAVWNTLQCPKEQYLTPINEHWISTDTRYRQMNFLKKQMK